VADLDLKNESAKGGPGTVDALLQAS
jgi:hypothetical protein